jgi:hypothetical protein
MKSNYYNRLSENVSKRLLADGFITKQNEDGSTTVTFSDFANDMIYTILNDNLRITSCLIEKPTMNPDESNFIVNAVSANGRKYSSSNRFFVECLRSLNNKYESGDFDV